MSFKRLVYAFLLPFVTISLLSAGTVKTLSVDCSKGDSIQKALEDKADELVIEVHGICNEEVVINRDRVTMRGSDPQTDGVRGIDPESPWTAAVLVREARHIRFENLGFSNGFNGLRVANSRRLVEVVNCRFTNNLRFGLVAVGSGVGVQDSYFAENGDGGLAASESSTVTCERCTVENNPGPGEGSAAVADIGSTLLVADNSLLAGETAATANHNSWLRIDSTTLNAAIDSIDVINGSNAVISNCQLGGAVLAFRNSLLQLNNVNQTANPFNENDVFHDSGLVLSGASPTSLLGNLVVGPLSRGSMRAMDSLQGDLICDSGSLADFACGDPNQISGTTDGCGSCVKPPECVATSGQEYILSGGLGAGDGIFVDDILRVYLNGDLIAEFSQGGGCCTPAAPVHFIADSGDELRVQAQDGNNCYSLGELYLQKADGTCQTQLTAGLSGPDCGNEPPEQIFFDQTFVLP